MTKTYIKTFEKATKEGVRFTLSEPASMNGGMKTTEWFASWDKIGKALFGDQYSDDSPKLQERK